MLGNMIKCLTSLNFMYFITCAILFYMYQMICRNCVRLTIVTVDKKIALKINPAN